MPVTGDDGSVICIITELDILQALNERPELTRVTAGDNITPEVATVKLETPATKLIKMIEDSPSSDCQSAKMKNLLEWFPVGTSSGTLLNLSS
jgi:CBS-domain-containing membrane protein